MDVKQSVIVPEICHCDFVMHKDGNDMRGLGIFDGDMLFFHAQQTAAPRDVVAFQVDGVTLLRQVVFFEEGRACFQAYPVNMVPPEEYAGPDLEKVRIIGKLVGLSRNI